jgi:putative nucleotidyltransferase with HDIG domain
MLDALCSAIEARDPYTRGHSTRVAALAVSLGEELGWTKSRLSILRLGGLLHDVGKLAVSSRVLAKPGPLDEHEHAAVQVHPVTGAKLLEPFPVARPALACVLFHHERWDGLGYPTGRAGGAIPVEARVLALADAFDAMTTDRPYRRAYDVDRALAEIRRCAGTQFDPRLVGPFVELWGGGTIAAAS